MGGEIRIERPSSANSGPSAAWRSARSFASGGALGRDQAVVALTGRVQRAQLGGRGRGVEVAQNQRRVRRVPARDDARRAALGHVKEAPCASRRSSANSSRQRLSKSKLTP